MYDQLLKGINHYRAFFRSLKDPTKWFHANDSMVSKNLLLRKYNYCDPISNKGDFGQYSNCSTATPLSAIL